MATGNSSVKASGFVVWRREPRRVLYLTLTNASHGDVGFPKGHAEPGEDEITTAVRETREETGLEISVVGVLDVLYTLDDPRKRANLAVYLARPVAGDLRPDDDAADARFFDLDDLPEQIAFQNNRAILTRLREQFPGGDIL